MAPDAEHDMEEKFRPEERNGMKSIPASPLVPGVASKHEQTPKAVPDSRNALEHCLNLLRKGDDTSRFVGLALLKSILDNEVELQGDPKIITRCWDAIPARFLDRLLRASESQQKSEDEARNMVQLAVSVLHAFASLLPVEAMNGEKLAFRSSALLGAISKSSSETVTHILHILSTAGSTQIGSLALFQTDNWDQLIKLAPKEPLVLDTIQNVFIIAALRDTERSPMQKKLDTTVSALVDLYEKADNKSPLFETLDRILSSLPPTWLQEKLPQPSPSWLKPLVKMLSVTTTSPNRSGPQSRQSAVLLSATLLRLYPSHTPALLFNPKPLSATSKDSKSASYLFVNLLLIDIRSSIPSLLETLNSPSYPQTSNRLAASYDLTSAFISFLIQSLDSESSSLPFSPSLLLNLRTSISQSLSLTIEYLRDRYDASIAGAPGLHPSARTRVDPSSTSGPLSITWDSATGGMETDPLTLAQVRTLALWLREDDGETLKKEAAGITDLFLALYTSTTLKNDDENKNLDFKSPVLIALEGLMTTTEALESFLGNSGFETLLADLQTILSPETFPRNRDSSAIALSIVRVLQLVVTAEEVGPAKEEWIGIVQLVSGFKLLDDNDNDGGNEEKETLDLKIELALLAADLIARFPPGVLRRRKALLAKAGEVVQKMIAREGVDEETKMELEGVVERLADCGI